jgi:SAM-dependent methyltransferase
MTNDSDKINISESECPLCFSKENKEIYDDHISLFSCRRCGIIFNGRHRQLEYNDDYFTGQYKNQYGKTYIEDFENIYAVSKRRISRIINIKKDIYKARLLEIGSAMGFFLKASQDSGIKDILGIEISGYAAKYCFEKFQINVINSSFNDADIKGKFDIISAWYFLEHAYDPLSVIRTIFNSLNTSGIFAFSTPSFFGPQYLFNRTEWFTAHPPDHRIDFSPGTVKKLFKDIGFRKIYVFPGGIHPERIIRKESVFFKLFAKIFNIFSGWFSFSDTIEVYAVK